MRSDYARRIASGRRAGEELGHLGYRNARFGSIEANECVTGPCEGYNVQIDSNS